MLPSTRTINCPPGSENDPTTFSPSVAGPTVVLKRRESARYWYELAGRLGERKHYKAMLSVCEHAVGVAPTKYTLQRVINQCAAAGKQEHVAKYREQLAEIEAAEVAA